MCAHECVCMCMFMSKCIGVLMSSQSVCQSIYLCVCACVFVCCVCSIIVHTCVLCVYAIFLVFGVLKRPHCHAYTIGMWPSKLNNHVTC